MPGRGITYQISNQHSQIMKGSILMRAAAAGGGRMAHGAFIQRTGVTLKLHEFDRVSGFAAGGDGMRAVVTGLTVHTTVTLRETIKGVILVELHGSSGRMAGIAARFVEPGVGIESHLSHAAMAVDAVHFAVGVD